MKFNVRRKDKSIRSSQLLGCESLESREMLSATAYEQPIFIPADNNLGPFASVDRALSNDPHEAKAWDNFSLSSEILLEGIGWAGAYIEPFATGDGAATPKTDFRIEIFADDVGLPGSVLHTFNLGGGDAGVSDASVTSTLLGHKAEDGGDVFSYEANLPFTSLSAGNYWLSIAEM